MCDVCEQTYNCLNNLRKHTRIEHTGITYNCDKCKFKAQSKHELAEHRAAKHEVHLFCDFGTSRQGHLSYHQKLHEDVSYDCSQCDFKAHLAKFVYEHMQLTHKTIEIIQVTDERIWITCSQCKYKTKWQNRFIKHKHSKHNGKIHVCNMCDFKSTKDVHLVNHKNSKHKRTSVIVFNGI